MRLFGDFLYNIRQKILKRSPADMYRRRGCSIGENFAINGGAIIDHSHAWLIEIGDDVTMAPYAHILAHDASTKVSLGYTRIGRVTIGNRVFIGASAIILPGVTVGDDVVIGAGSVVTRNIPSNSVCIGNPAKVIGNKIDFIAKKRTELDSAPCYSSEYTTDGGIDQEKKQKMKRELEKNIGYVI